MVTKRFPMSIVWVIGIMKCGIILVRCIIMMFEHCENLRLVVLFEVAVNMV